MLYAHGGPRMKKEKCEKTVNLDMGSIAARRLVPPAKGMLPSSSLDILSSQLRLSRRKDTKKCLLTPQAKDALREAHEKFLLSSGIQPDKNLLSLWEHYRKKSTVNTYANPWMKWRDYCRKSGSPPLPADPFRFSSWLAAASLSDQTASPTDNRCAAINFFSTIANTVSPTISGVVQMTRQSIVRRLGYKKCPKNPLMSEHVQLIVSYFLERDTLQGLANAFRTALAYEASLRWDDFSDTLFGDFIQTDNFVRVFVVDTKTDNSKSGQWATFAVSESSTSAYQLAQALKREIQSFASPYIRDNLASFPIMFKSESLKATQHGLIRTVTYNEFFAEIKSACKSVNLNPKLFGTHSFRRGHVTDQFAAGIPDQIIKFSGRWKSNAFEAYIDHSMLFALQIHSLRLGV